MSMGISGWGVNLSGQSIPVYGPKNGEYTAPGAQIGEVTPNECCAGGVAAGTGWEGWGRPVYFINTSGKVVLGMFSDSAPQPESFADYASDGTKWNRVYTLKRYVQYSTNSYYAGDGSLFKPLPAGSYVWLSIACTRGDNHFSYIEVTAVQPKGDKKYDLGEGRIFVDLVNGHFLNKGSILLRKA